MAKEYIYYMRKIHLSSWRNLQVPSSQLTPQFCISLKVMSISKWCQNHYVVSGFYKNRVVQAELMPSSLVQCLEYYVKQSKKTVRGLSLLWKTVSLLLLSQAFGFLVSDAVSCRHCLYEEKTRTRHLPDPGLTGELNFQLLFIWDFSRHLSVPGLRGEVE